MQKRSFIETIAMQHTRKAATGDVKSTTLVFGALQPLENNQDNNLPELINQFRALHASREAADRAHPRPSVDDEPDAEPANEPKEDSPRSDAT